MAAKYSDVRKCRRGDGQNHLCKRESTAAPQFADFRAIASRATTWLRVPAPGWVAYRAVIQTSPCVGCEGQARVLPAGRPRVELHASGGGSLPTAWCPPAPIRR